MKIGTKTTIEKLKVGDRFKSFNESAKRWERNIKIDPLNLFEGRGGDDGNPNLQAINHLGQLVYCCSNEMVTYLGRGF